MIDLHVHTKISDNSLTTPEVIKLAREEECILELEGRVCKRRGT